MGRLMELNAVLGKSVKTQVELVQQLLKGLYLLKRKPELIFDTG